MLRRESSRISRRRARGQIKRKNKCGKVEKKSAVARAVRRMRNGGLNLDAATA